MWVAAAVLCVPLVASNSLNNLREYLTYDSTNGQAAMRLNASDGIEIELASVANKDAVKKDWRAATELPMTSLPLPPMPEANNEVATESDPGYEASEYSPVSLPAPESFANSPDPGSLLELSHEFKQEEEVKQKSVAQEKMEQEKVRQEREINTESTSDQLASNLNSNPNSNPDPGQESEGIDFLFGEEDKLGDKTDDFLFGEDDKLGAKTDRVQDAPKVSMSEPSQESPDWLFSDSPSETSEHAMSEPPPFDVGSPLPNGTDSQLIPDLQFQGSNGSDLQLPPSELPQSAFAPELAPPLPGAPMMGTHLVQPPQIDQTQSDYYVELEAGTDWWTPHCQQAIWQSVPSQQAGLDGIVFAAIQNSPYVKMINTRPQMAQTVVDESDALYDWSAFVEASWSDVDRPVVSLLDTGTAGGRFVQEQLLFESGVKKNLRTGGHLRVGHAWQRTDNNSLFLSPPDQATAQLLLDYRQPLLRGAGKHISNNQIVLAQIDVEATQSNSQALLQQFLVDVVTEYWELHFARGALMQKLRCAERAEQLLNELSTFPESATRNRDLVRIQAVAAARRTELIRARNQIATRQETLLNLTYGASMPDSTSLELVPVESPGMFVVPYDLAHVTEMAVQNRAEVKVALASIRASAVRQNLALNDLKPRLDAIVSTFISGVDEAKDVGGALGDAFDFDPSYSVGLSFEMPLGRRAANARLSRQQLDYQRLQHQLEQTLGNVRLDARLAWRDVSSIATEMENQKMAVHQAGQELEYATQQAATGVSQSADNASFLIDDLLRSQEGLAVAESKLLRSQTDLSIALVKLKRATGQLLQTAPIPQVSDHTVQQASYEQPASFGQLEPYSDLAPVAQQKDAESVWQAPASNNSSQADAFDLWDN